MLTLQHGRLFLRLARQQIEQRLGVKPRDPVSADELNDPALRQQCGVFVTLRKRNNLRGCIGSLAAVETIVDGIRRHAINAAFHDHRFAPLTAGELPQLHIEVSVLSEPQPLAYADSEQLLHLLRPGVDGVILSSPQGHSATFLPQVWQQLPSPEDFLCHLCRKAGLADQAWRSENITISTYQVQSFEEPAEPGIPA